MNDHPNKEHELSCEAYGALVLELSKVLPKQLVGTDLALLIYGAFFVNFQLTDTQARAVVERLVQLHFSYSSLKGAK